MNSLEHHLRSQTVDGQTFFWHQLRWHAVRRVFPTEKPSAVADVGAGAGMLGRYLEREYPESMYLFEEPIESLRQALVRRYGSDADLSALRPINAPVVTLLDVLEHQEAGGIL